MSALEKTKDLLHEPPEKKEEPPEDIFKNLAGVLPDTGKTLEEYREERLRERYETASLPVRTPAEWVKGTGTV